MGTETVKDIQWWEKYFAPGGGWETNCGREQTRLFAEAFTREVNLDLETNFSLLDVGCALGDAIDHFSSQYPRATLYGIDFSHTAIQRCRRDLGLRAKFGTNDMMNLQWHYDVIYVSNVLEHFADFKNRARYLARHCARLCILVPYKEVNNTEDLQPDPHKHHQHTFREKSFDYLITEGIVIKKTIRIFSCPGAWGWKLSKKMWMRIRNFFRIIEGKRSIDEPRQILYDLQIKESNVSL
jgi:hypothetical protein